MRRRSARKRADDYPGQFLPIGPRVTNHVLHIRHAEDVFLGLALARA
jgi:hypothetical protein